MVSLSRYQQQILTTVRDNINEAIAFLERGYTIDFLNLSLKTCLDNLGKLTGEIFSQEILESIFSNFCIGK